MLNTLYSPGSELLRNGSVSGGGEGGMVHPGLDTAAHIPPMFNNWGSVQVHYLYIIYTLSTHYLHSIYTLSTLTRGAGAGVWRLDQVLWTLGFSAILVTAILGNTIVLWIITGNVQTEICYLLSILSSFFNLP